MIGELVAEKDLLQQSENDERRTERDAMFKAFAKRPAAELLHDFRPAHERARDRLRKEADVERLAIQRLERRAAAALVDQVHHVMKGEEADAERQRQLPAYSELRTRDTSG
jgi:hypothetical protein